MSAAERSEWARRMIVRAGAPVSAYGSAEWLALPEGDSRKVAAVVVAAEARARESDQLEESLWAECIAASRAHKVAEDARHFASRDAHREEWAGLDNLIGNPLAGARRQALGDVA